jgi:hypothetical protein
MNHPWGKLKRASEHLPAVPQPNRREIVHFRGHSRAEATTALSKSDPAEA